MFTITTKKLKKPFIVFSLIFALCFSMLSCSNEAVLDAEDKRVSADGFSITLNHKFEYESSRDHPLKYTNGDLVFEAFFMEKFYFEEKGADVSNAFEALEYVGIGKEQGAECFLNEHDQPSVEFSLLFEEDDTMYDLYYICLEDEERFWFACFYSNSENFPLYRDEVINYFGSATAEVVED